MATGKRYYWIKLKKDFLTSDTIEFLMSNDRGSDYVVLYLQLCTATINTSGRLESRIGEIIVPFDIDRIQREGRYFPRETVEKALDIYKRIGLIYEDCNGTLIIADYDNMVGSETDYAKQKRTQRNVDNGVDNGVDNVHTESESDKRVQRIENRHQRKEKETSSSTSSSEELRARTREDRDIDVLLRFLLAHKIRIARPDVSKLLNDGFDLDTIFWIIEKTERAEPKNMTSYFNSVCEDKLDHRATTIDLIREAECDSIADYEFFDRHLAFWRKEYQSFKGEDDKS